MKAMGKIPWPFSFRTTRVLSKTLFLQRDQSLHNDSRYQQNDPECICESVVRFAAISLLIEHPVPRYQNKNYSSQAASQTAEHENIDQQ